MSKIKILLVDDEPNVRATIKELLVFKNYDVKSAADGQQALDMLDYWMPDLILCDMVMPVMNGSELFDHIKRNSTFSQIPFVFLSAKNEVELIQQCLRDGADDFLVKPFKIDELIILVTTIVTGIEKKRNAANKVIPGRKNNSFINTIFLK